MASPGADRGREIFDHIWVTSRGIEEYREYFRLTDDDFAGAILDCAAGASSFVAHVNRHGGFAIAADRAYGSALSDLLAGARDDLAITGSTHDKNLDLLGPGIFADTESLVANRAASFETFAADISAEPARYVPVELPMLPFRDNSFDLVLSGYLLFCYGDRIGLEFHRATIAELLRVARREVRLTPICTAGGLVPAWRDELLTELGGVADVEILEGINCTLRPATQTLVLHVR